MWEGQTYSCPLPQMVAGLKLMFDAIRERNYLHAYKVGMEYCYEWAGRMVGRHRRRVGGPGRQPGAGAGRRAFLLIFIGACLSRARQGGAAFRAPIVRGSRAAC